jgi:hypothetical protein
VLDDFYAAPFEEIRESEPSASGDDDYACASGGATDYLLDGDADGYADDVDAAEVLRRATSWSPMRSAFGRAGP